MLITLILAGGALVYAAKNGWLSAAEAWINAKREQVTSQSKS